MHPTLERQLKKLLGTADISAWPKPWQDLFHVVSDTYKHYDDDHILI